MESDCTSQPTVYASFTKKGEHVYRDSTYIQWGESSTSIGACLLLHPGAAQPGKEIRKQLDERNNGRGQIDKTDKTDTTDPTMKQLIALIKAIYGASGPLSGSFIYIIYLPCKIPIIKMRLMTLNCL